MAKAPKAKADDVKEFDPTAVPVPADDEKDIDWSETPPASSSAEIPPAAAEAPPVAPAPDLSKTVTLDQFRELMERAGKIEEENKLLREKLEAKDTAKPVSLSDLPPRNWLVRLSHNPEWIVEARTEFEAFETYKKTLGILSSEHSPEVTESSLPAGRLETI